MITRIFTVDIHHDFKDDFEHDFSTLSRELVAGSKGLIDLELLKPSDDTNNKYAMISRWENSDAIENLFGEDWQKAVIPEPMKHYAKSHQIFHFENWQ